MIFRSHSTRGIYGYWQKCEEGKKKRRKEEKEEEEDNDDEAKQKKKKEKETNSDQIRSKNSYPNSFKTTIYPNLELFHKHENLEEVPLHYTISRERDGSIMK